MKTIVNKTIHNCLGEHNEIIAILYKLGWYRTNKDGTTLYNPEGKEIASNWSSEKLNNRLSDIPEVIESLKNEGYEIAD